MTYHHVILAGLALIVAMLMVVGLSLCRAAAKGDER